MALVTLPPDAAAAPMLEVLETPDGVAVAFTAEVTLKKKLFTIVLTDGEVEFSSCLPIRLYVVLIILYP